jgi:hypothetical protein
MRRLLFCVVALVAGLPGCSSAPPGPAPSSPAPSTSTASPGPTATAAARDFCLVALPTAWRTALSNGRIAHAADESLVIDAVAEDGSSVFGDSYRGGVREVVWLRGDRRSAVMRLPDPDQQVFGVAFDGRWLVFSVWDRPELNTPWTMYAWDSSTGGRPRQLGRATVPGPYPYPIVYNGRAFWTLPVGAQVAQVHMTDLGTGTDRVIRSGWAGYPFRFGSLVVWPETTAQTTAIKLRAASIRAGDPAGLPTELSEPLSRPLFVNGDADAYVWSTNNLATLRVWRSGTPSPITIITMAPLGQYLQWPQVGGPLVTWDNGTAQYVADLRTGSYAQITPEAGATKLSGDALVVTYAPSGKASHAVLDSTLVRPSRLPALPTCP